MRSQVGEQGRAVVQLDPSEAHYWFLDSQTSSLSSAHSTHSSHVCRHQASWVDNLSIEEKRGKISFLGPKFRTLYCKNNENSAKIRMFSDNLILFSPFPQNLPLKNGAFGNFDNIDFLEEYLPVSSHSHSHMRPVWGCPDCVLWFQKLPEHKPTSPAFPGRDRERATGWDHSIIHTLTIMSHCKINLSTGSRIAYLIVDVVCKCTRCHVTDSFFS